MIIKIEKENLKMEDKEIMSVVADNEDMAMPKEVEETLNQSNTEERKIKRGTEVKTEKAGAIYALTFLKDIANLSLKYYSDWTSWLENENNDPLKDAILDFLTENEDEYEEEEYRERVIRAEKIKNTKFTNGLLENTFDKITLEIDNAITLLENNCNIDKFKLAMENIENSLQTLNTITDYFFERGWIDYINFHYIGNFYDGVVSLPVYKSFSIIGDIVKAIKEIRKNWFEMEEEQC